MNPDTRPETIPVQWVRCDQCVYGDPQPAIKWLRCQNPASGRKGGFVGDRNLCDAFSFTATFIEKSK